MMVLAAVIGVASVIVGLTIAHHAGVDASATVALIPIVSFFVVLAIKARQE